MDPVVQVKPDWSQWGVAAAILGILLPAFLYAAKALLDRHLQHVDESSQAMRDIKNSFDRGNDQICERIDRGMNGIREAINRQSQKFDDNIDLQREISSKISGLLDHGVNNRSG